MQAIPSLGFLFNRIKKSENASPRNIFYDDNPKNMKRLKTSIHKLIIQSCSVQLKRGISRYSEQIKGELKI